MVLVTRFIGGSRGVPIDAFLNETHVSELNITLNPIETGADVADHAHIKPKELTIHGAVDYLLRPTAEPPPLSPVGPANFAADTSWFREQSTSVMSRMSSAYSSLVQVQESRQPFEIVTGLAMYKNMLIESITVTRDKDNAQILEFDAVLREIKFAHTSYTSSGIAEGIGTPAPGEPTQTGGGTVDSGQFNPATIPPGERGSVLSWLLDLRRQGQIPQAANPPGGA